MAEYDDNDPQVIRAKAEAEATELEARSKLHPVAQAIYALFDSIRSLIAGLGCLLIIAIIVIAIFAPRLFELVNH